MIDGTYRIRRTTRATALLISLSLVAPLLTGCGGGKNDSGANQPPRDESGGRVSAPPKQGMSTGKKVALVAGAAALYYMYKRSQAKHDPDNRQYYLSKNGRVYYRDANKQAVWVTPPAQPIEVPMDEIDRYPRIKDYQGYNNSTNGRDTITDN